MIEEETVDQKLESIVGIVSGGVHSHVATVVVIAPPRTERMIEESTTLELLIVPRKSSQSLLHGLSL